MQKEKERHTKEKPADYYLENKEVIKENLKKLIQKIFKRRKGQD